MCINNISRKLVEKVIIAVIVVVVVIIVGSIGRTKENRYSALLVLRTLMKTLFRNMSLTPDLFP